MGIKERRRVWYDENEGRVYLVDENLVTALVPSEIACFESCVVAHLVSILASGRSQEQRAYLAGEDEADRGLDLARRDGRLLVLFVASM